MHLTAVGETPPVPRKRPAAFRMTADPDARHGAIMLFERLGTNIGVVIWSRVFGSRIERDAVISAARKDSARLDFWGRLVRALGAAPLKPMIDAVLAGAHKDAEERRRQASRHRTINLYARERKGRFYLDFERASSSVPEWSMRFDARIERDRMCDFLRWQKASFRQYLAFAAEHNDHALEKFLVDAMFETEARLKREGRVAGGMRPLRMWRGE